MNSPDYRRYPGGDLVRRMIFGATVILILALLTGCGNSNAYYVVGNRDQQHQLRVLFRLYEKAKRTGADRVFLIEQITNLISVAGYDDRESLFLTTYVERNPDDAYDGYYLFMAARNYLDSDARPIAAYYFRRVVTGYPDVVVQGKSIQFEALTQLTRLSRDPQIRADAYQSLIARFSDQIDVASAYYFLGKSYAALSQWNDAFAAYREFLKFPDAQVSGFPNARKDIISEVAFYDSAKDWTIPTLGELASGVRAAIQNVDPRALLRYKAKVNFFAMSWDQQSTADPDPTDFPVQAFLSRYIQIANNLEVSTDGSEAYLRTTGWADPRISTWYLYFRKVDFPADPMVNGRWEWAGVYFGDRT
ncbi:MAG TPA: tetratricopeptide repeat protein [Spirochaetia bacterium]|nr:tetratricopeptide repeat protein [Spirochaetia bacterium]